MSNILGFLLGHIIGIVIGSCIVAIIETQQCKKRIRSTDMAIAEYCKHKSETVNNPTLKERYKIIGEMLK